MPARATLAPRGVPHGLARFGGLPEGEVQRVVLLLVGFDAGADLELVDVTTGHGAVAGVTTNREVDVAVAGRIGVALLDETGDHLDHGLDLLRGARTDIRVEDAHAVHLLDEGVGELAREVLGSATLLVGALDDLVVHVGQVLGEGDLVALVHKVAANDVEGQERAAVADVNLVIDGGAADVHANLAGFDGCELDLLV